jgi:O-methyltransferase
MSLPESPAIAAYLELLKTCLSGTLHEETYRPLNPDKGGLAQAAKGVAAGTLKGMARALGLEVVKRVKTDPAKRSEGKDWPAQAETMIGTQRLNQLQACVTQVLKDDVPGDLIECGVWRGGATIFMRGILKAYADAARRVWVADSFAGLPPPKPGVYAADAGDVHYTYSQLAVSQEQVQANFARYGLLDDRVRFLKGWFKDTLHVAPIERLSVLRADGDMYESTVQIFDALYAKLSPGGYCIVDDYGAVPACKQATDEFRAKHNIREEIHTIDWTGVYWRKN